MESATSNNKAMTVFETFQSLVKPFMDCFPRGNIIWDTYETSNRIGFEGKFEREDGSYIRFTEEVSRGGEKA